MANLFPCFIDNFFVSKNLGFKYSPWRNSPYPCLCSLDEDNCIMKHLTNVSCHAKPLFHPCQADPTYTSLTIRWFPLSRQLINLIHSRTFSLPPSVSIKLNLCFCLFVCWLSCPSVCLTSCLPVCLSVCLSVCWSIGL